MLTAERIWMCPLYVTSTPSIQSRDKWNVAAFDKALNTGGLGGRILHQVHALVVQHVRRSLIVPSSHND